MESLFLRDIDVDYHAMCLVYGCKVELTISYDEFHGYVGLEIVCK